jgi:hypothetical protein
MPVDVLTQTVIPRPFAVVADYAVDPANAPAAPLMAKAMSRANAKDLARLKKLLEAR